MRRRKFQKRGEERALFSMKALPHPIQSPVSSPPCGFYTQTNTAICRSPGHKAGGQISRRSRCWSGAGVWEMLLRVRGWGGGKGTLRLGNVEELQ